VLTFNHAALYVSNLEKSTRFYCEFLGCEVITSYGMPNGGHITYLRCDGGQIELLGSAGIRHIAFKTDDLDGMAARLQAAGVQFRSLPRVAGSGIGRLMFFYDPDFIEVEVIQRDTDW
jgi:catechol 2,3-dioxygenase-like lactoylglutathione lyase family enzyme